MYFHMHCVLLMSLYSNLTFPMRTLLTELCVCCLTLSLFVFSTSRRSSLAANTLATLMGASLLSASLRDWWARVNSSSLPCDMI